jgi:hypothetical protein
MLKKTLKEQLKEVTISKNEANNLNNELLKDISKHIARVGVLEIELEKSQEKLKEANKLIDKMKRILEKYAPAINNKYLFNKIRFIERFTKNKQLVSQEFGDWFLVNLENLDNVVSNVENKTIFEIKEL